MRSNGFTMRMVTILLLGIFLAGFQGNRSTVAGQERLTVPWLTSNQSARCDAMATHVRNEFNTCVRACVCVRVPLYIFAESLIRLSNAKWPSFARCSSLTMPLLWLPQHGELLPHCKDVSNERKFEYSFKNRKGERTNSHIHVQTARCTSYMYMTVRFLVPTSCIAEDTQFNCMREC